MSDLSPPPIWYSPDEQCNVLDADALEDWVAGYAELLSPDALVHIQALNLALYPRDRSVPRCDT